MSHSMGMAKDLWIDTNPVKIDFKFLLQWHHMRLSWCLKSLQLHGLFKSLFRLIAKKASKFRIIGLLWGNLPVTTGFLSPTASFVENISMLWCHHAVCYHKRKCILIFFLLRRKFHAYNCIMILFYFFQQVPLFERQWDNIIEKMDMAG